MLGGGGSEESSREAEGRQQRVASCLRGFAEELKGPSRVQEGVYDRTEFQTGQLTLPHRRFAADYVRSSALSGRATPPTCTAPVAWYRLPRRGRHETYWTSMTANITEKWACQSDAQGKASRTKSDQSRIPWNCSFKRVALGTLAGRAGQDCRVCVPQDPDSRPRMVWSHDQGGWPTSSRYVLITRVHRWSLELVRNVGAEEIEGAPSRTRGEGRNHEKSSFNAA